MVGGSMKIFVIIYKSCLVAHQQKLDAHLFNLEPYQISYFHIIMDVVYVRQDIGDMHTCWCGSRGVIGEGLWVKTS